MIVEPAPAKINLALHVTGQRADGYHLLDSLVVFADVGDDLRFEHADTLSLHISGPLAKGIPVDGRNLVMQAAGLFDLPKGARISLDKGLPHAAGIGGGSSDAAAALRGLSRLWQCALPGADQILTLGADLPVCLANRPQRMRGIGEDLSNLPTLPTLHAVLVNPRVLVPTEGVFKALARKDNPPLDPPVWQDYRSFVDWLSRQRNDLEIPARAAVPEVAQALLALATENADLTRMSGSGATCFGLYETKAAAETAATRLQSSHPKWWVVATKILS